MRRKKIFFGLFIILVQIGFSQSDSKINILFIGNSLTYTNNLPKLIEHEAKRKGKRIKTKTIAYPNYSLEDHWNDGNVQKLIKSNNYNYVIIQQGPSSQKYGRLSLIEYGQKFSEICKESNSQLAYFMVWPSRQYYHTFDGVIKNHTDAAHKNKALLCPIGKIWKEHFEKTNDYSYYGLDGFHPSLKGSKEAAKIIVKTLVHN